MGTIYVTERIHDKLRSLSKTKSVYLEGLANIILVLALSNDELVNQAVNVINTLNIKGGADLESRLG